MPIYEYRCPNGHTFERFQSMSAAAPEKCELVLYPIAIHYKGSGFYSTDYGKKGAAAAKKDGGDSGSSSGDSSSGDSSAPKTDAKPAADKKPAKPSSD